MGPPGYVRDSPGRWGRAKSLLHELLGQRLSPLKGDMKEMTHMKERDEPEAGPWRVAGHLHAVVRMQSFSSGWSWLHEMCCAAR